MGAEHTEKDVGPYPVLDIVPDRTDIYVDALERTKYLFYIGKVLIKADHLC